MILMTQNLGGRVVPHSYSSKDWSLGFMQDHLCICLPHASASSGKTWMGHFGWERVIGVQSTVSDASSMCT